MRCKHCPALGCEGYEYPEYFCSFGLDDSDLATEFKDGEPGCRLNRRVIETRLKKSNEAEHMATMLDNAAYHEEIFQKETGINISDPNGKYVDEAKHCLGMDRRKPYKRHGKLFYSAYRNYFSVGANGSEVWETLAKIGYADSKGNFYWLNEVGKIWLGKVLGMTIKEEK